jgi:hypothetical protein
MGGLESVVFSGWEQLAQTYPSQPQNQMALAKIQALSNPRLRFTFPVPLSLILSRSAHFDLK